MIDDKLKSMKSGDCYV